jgi:hypothetical protein
LFFHVQLQPKAGKGALHWKIRRWNIGMMEEWNNEKKELE